MLLRVLVLAVWVGVFGLALQEVVDLTDDLAAMEQTPASKCFNLHPACRRWHSLKMCDDSMYAGYMARTCYASCHRDCRSLGENNSTKAAQEDPAMAAINKAIEEAKGKIKGANEWAEKMQLAQNNGCPCPGRDFFPKKPGVKTPSGAKEKAGNNTDPDDAFAGLSAEEANALVRHYIKKYAEGQSSWTKHNEEQLKAKGKELKVADEKTTEALHNAKGDFLRMQTDPMFKSWFKDMCPCKGDEGYEDMMAAYFKVSGNSTAQERKKNWHVYHLEEHRKQKAKAAALIGKPEPDMQ